MSKYIDADALKKEFRSPKWRVNSAFGFRLMDIDKIIDEMPAVDMEPARKWILCGERLSKLGKKVLVYWERFNRNTNEILGFIDIMCQTSERGWYCEGQGEPNGEVIAWQPLPKLPKMDGGREWKT